MTSSRATGDRTEVGAPIVTQPRLSIVVPVFNQAEDIVDNVREIAARVEDRYHEALEVIVVSDGSVDATQEQLLAHRDARIRVLHYDRNLGKGYAIKVGALEARGDWVAYVDADLDLDPSSIPAFVEVAEDQALDFVIGSKRHPDSSVHYPATRRIGSFVYQQLVRVLFKLDVRDTQVGLKVFRRAVADEVLPLLLVKRYAFDLELLAVSKALGFGRIREMPITLEYRFSGSGVRSLAVFRALVDTAAIFYRIRILRYYERKRQAFGRFGWTRPRNFHPTVTLASASADGLAGVDYPGETAVVTMAADTPEERHAVAARADSDVVAFVADGARPPANWLSATIPFLAREEVAAVVTATVARHEGPLGARLAAAVQESRAGGGSLYFRFTPGNLRFVSAFPADTIVCRRERFAALGAETPLSEVCRELTAGGDVVVYTPESFVVADPPPFVRPHLRRMAAYGRARGDEIRRNGIKALRWSTWLVVFLVAWALGAGLWETGPTARLLWYVLSGAYILLLVTAAVAAGFRFRSSRVGLLMPFAAVSTHVVYCAALLRGLAVRR